VLFEMLTGGPPYRGTTPQEILNRHFRDPVPSVRREMADLPLWVDLALQKALAKDPTDRFRTGGEFAAALSPAAEEAKS